MKKLVFSLIALLFSASTLLAQTGVKGKVVDVYGQALVGANVVEANTSNGGVTDINGRFSIELPAGEKEISVSFIGYEPKTVSVQVQSGSMTDMGAIVLRGSTIGLGSIDIIADRARERETPVALSNISEDEIKAQLGSRDLPMVMNITPSVYATQQGGGAGDARINVRGFDQRNVAIMINGVPVNDMENGWVYWSNWDGVADATSSIQMQRGLSAVNLATPSIGGTMNIITSPADHKAGASARFEYGSGNFVKSTISGHTGLIDDKFALSASLVRKVGDGVIDGTWTDAWAYYFGASYIVNKNHRLEVFAVGAPQRHGQNLYKQNVAAYSHEYAKEIGADDETLDAFPEAEAGRYYNQNWNAVSTSNYTKQFFNGKRYNRHEAHLLNERENFYHKPLVNLNWYSRWNDKVSQFTTVYYSGGQGGGTGTYGSVEWDYASNPTRVVDWDATYENNTRTDTAFGILRNSRNNQWTIGAISKVKIDFTENFRVSAGLDWRTAEIEHYREVRDLLGGKFFVYDGNEFDNTPEDHQKRLGDKVDYNFTNTVDWIGYYAQFEYSNDIFTAYGTFGNSYIKYSYVNHFKKQEGTNSELNTETDFFAGYQIKGGLSYRPVEGMKLFGNVGYISRAPIFDNVIDDRSAVTATDPQNEIFTAFEVGAVYKTNNFDVKANFYFTNWADRSRNIAVYNQDGTEGFIFVQGMDQLHRGFELEASFQPVSFLAIGAMASVANWEHTNDVSGTYKDYSGGSATDEEYNFYVDGLKVGDAPQTQFAAIAKIYPVKNMIIQIDWRHYSKHYAYWDPFSRTDEADTEQVWETPDYMLFDLHASYDVPLTENKYNLTIFAHIFNLFDEMYIQDATDNSRYNGYYGTNNEFSHTVNSAEVFLGMPRTFNIGLEFNF